MRNALERTIKNRTNGRQKSGASCAKARAWYAIGVAPTRATLCFRGAAVRCVISLDRRVYDCTKFVFEGARTTTGRLVEY